MMRGAKTSNGVHCIKEGKQTQTVENTPINVPRFGYKLGGFSLKEIIEIRYNKV